MQRSVPAALCNSDFLLCLSLSYIFRSNLESNKNILRGSGEEEKNENDENWLSTKYQLVILGFRLVLLTEDVAWVADWYTPIVDQKATKTTSLLKSN